MKERNWQEESSIQNGLGHWMGPRDGLALYGVEDGYCTTLERAQALRDIADSVCTAKVALRIGSVCEVLVEGREEDGQLYGRAQCQAPEVDGVVYLGSGEVGEFASVRIADTLLYEMESE